jgi:hypothetical protein
MSGCCSGRPDVRVVVERLVVGGQTCDRCASTVDAVRDAIDEVAPRLAGAGVVLELSERALSGDEVAGSNRVLVNERPAEEWLGGSVSMTECVSCGELLGESTCCRSYEIGGVSAESLTASQIARAILLAAGLDDEGAGPGSGEALEVVLVTGPGCG